MKNPPLPASPVRLAEAFAALGEAQRVGIVGLLARRAHYGEELAEVLGLNAATVSHHLQRLRHAGLVRPERQSPYILFHLERAVLGALAEQLRSPEAWPAGLGLPTDDELAQRFLRSTLDKDGRIPSLPRQRRARRVVLRHVAQQFETGRLYPAREVRRILLQFTDDPDPLEKALRELGWLQRSGAAYRRIEEVEAT